MLRNYPKPWEAVQQATCTSTALDSHLLSMLKFNGMFSFQS